MKRNSTLAVVAGLVLFACKPEYLVTPDDDIIGPMDREGVPVIEVDPLVIDFESVDVLEDLEQVRLVRVGNVGDADLHIEDISLVDATGPFDISSIQSVLLGPGDTTELQVSFDPGASGGFETWLRIDSDDPVTPTAEVKLLGEGIAPAIELDPVSYDFGTSWVGCESELELTVTNVGSAELVVHGLEYHTASEELKLGEIGDLNGADVGLMTLAPAEFQELFVSYLPTDEYADTGYLQVDSNDPDQPTVQVRQDGSADIYGTQLDVYEQPIRGATDILFAVDKSGSMDQDLASVRDNFGVFVQTMVNLDSDFHVAFVVRDDGCVNGSNLWIDNTFSETGAVNAVSDMLEAPAGSHTEMGFTLLEHALAETGSGGCNEGFLREGAKLNVVGVSDEPEQSANSWSYYVTHFQSYVAAADDLVVHAVGGDYPSGCGGNDPYIGFYEATVATGGQFLSICASDWASHLAALAEASAAILDSFALTAEPVPETIEVHVDGVTATLGWSYDEAENQVVFDPDYVPEGGATIEISYALRGDCER